MARGRGFPLARVLLPHFFTSSSDFNCLVRDGFPLLSLSLNPALVFSFFKPKFTRFLTHSLIHSFNVSCSPSGSFLSHSFSTSRRVYAPLMRQNAIIAALVSLGTAPLVLEPI